MKKCGSCAYSIPVEATVCKFCGREVDELRERFTPNDPDLEARYTDRVKAIVRFAIREARGQDFPP